MGSTVLSVSQINSYVKLLLDADRNLSSVFICGEISNFNNNYRSGHLYFSLKDDKAVIKAVMFSSSASRLRFLPADGMKVIVSGRVSVYEATGQYQVYVESMQPDGVGALAVAYEQLKAKLQAEGVFDERHKLAIPEFPKAVGVITSPTGAVIQDIKNVISRRYPIASLILCPVAVQGVLASEQLTEAVNLFNTLNNVDVIIIGRGGGSFEDLNCFNNEKLVRSIYNSRIPIISAVGHETDFTLCDFVSDLRAPTPSAAAELAVPDRAQVCRDIEDIFTRMSEKMQGRLFCEFQTVDNLADTMSPSGLKDLISDEKQSLSRIGKDMYSTINNKINFEKLSIGGTADRINSLNPINLLKRGYSFVLKDSMPVSSVSKLAKNDIVSVKMADGEIKAKVEEIV